MNTSIEEGMNRVLNIVVPVFGTTNGCEKRYQLRQQPKPQPVKFTEVIIMRAG
jgi:hypothetical protein